MGRRAHRLLLAATLFTAGAGCRQKQLETGAGSPPPAGNSAHPEPFVHPPIPAEPTPSPSQARPECALLALDSVAARIRETQKAALRALEPPRAKRARAHAKGPASGCGSPEMSELDRQVKADLADRVRICVGQDGPLDAEWNLLDASLATLGVCVDCARPAVSRAPDCRRAADLITQAETEAAAREKTAAPH